MSEDQAINNVWAENVKLRDENQRLREALASMLHMVYYDDRKRVIDTALAGQKEG